MRAADRCELHSDLAMGLFGLNQTILKRHRFFTFGSRSWKISPKGEQTILIYHAKANLRANDDRLLLRLAGCFVSSGLSPSPSSPAT